MLKYILTLLFFSVIITCNAQTAAVEGSLVYQRAAGFKYLEDTHKGDQPGKELPVIIGFHYSSSTPQETFSEYDQIKTPHRLILPQGNFKKRSGYTYFPPDYYSKDSLTQISISKITLDSIADFVRAIGKKYNCKPIVAGFSQGGDISFLLAIYYPELITAAFPLAGFIHRQRFEDAVKHTQNSIPIHIFQGEDDKIVSIDYTRKEVKELKPYFNIDLKSYRSLGHDFSPAMKKDYCDLISKILD